MTGSLQVKNGVYYIVINTYENGNRKQKWINTKLSEKSNKRKAEKMLKNKLFEFENVAEEQITEASTILFSDYICEWLNHAEKKVDSVTYQGYRLIADRHVIPYFEKKKLKLSDVNRRVIQKFLDEKYENGRLDGKGGLSPKTIRELKNILNQTLTYAMRDELITSNPCALVDLPAKNKPETNFYTVNQVNELLRAVRDEPLYPVIKTAIIYGLRRSEILGLKWDSFDFDNDTFHIIHTVVKVSSIVEKDKTKNKSSRRSFPLSPEMKEMFIGIKEEQINNKKLFGKKYTNTDYVFCWPDGRPFSPDYVSKKFPKLLAKNKLPHIRFHELRHSCASILINQGKSLKEVQVWMGHSDIGVTADIYGHLETARKVELAETMSKLILD